MVVTHKSIAEQKKKPIPKKEYDPRRVNMTKAEALEANRLLRENAAKVAAYADSLKKQPVVEQSTVVVDSPTDNSKEIEKLEKQLEAEKGPGSRARKDKIREKIEALKGDG